MTRVRSTRQVLSLQEGLAEAKAAARREREEREEAHTVRRRPHHLGQLETLIGQFFYGELGLSWPTEPQLSS